MNLYFENESVSNIQVQLSRAQIHRSTALLLRSES